jgi:hypothetical protein
MKKRMMIMAVCAVIAMGLVMPLTAQVLPGPESNQINATAGVFGTDVDNFMSVNYYDEVNFGKWFGYLGGGTAFSTVNLGYATKFGGGSGEGEGGGSGLYLGVFYTGNIVSFNTDETKTLRTTWDINLQQMLTREDEAFYSQTSTYTDNHISALIGVAGMGIRVGFMEELTVYNTPYNVNRNDTSTVTENADGSKTYTNNDSISYEESEGYLLPYLQWGMKLKLGSNVIAPRVGIGVLFFQDKLIDKYYDYTTGRTEYQGKITGVDEVTNVGRNNGYTGLNIAVGADYYLNDTMYVGLDYILGFDIYNQDFGQAGGSGSAEGTIEWYNINRTTNYLDRTVKFDAAQIDVTKRSNIRHQIIPALWKEAKAGDNLKLGLLFQLPMAIVSQTESDYSDVWSTTETKYNDTNFSSRNTTDIYEAHYAGTSTETSYFGIAPALGIGASYTLIPGRFTINAGVRVSPLSYESISKKRSINGVDSSYSKTETGPDGGKYTSAESKTVSAVNPVEDSITTQSLWAGLNGSVAAGFVFSFNENFSLDLLAGANLSTNGSGAYDGTFYETSGSGLYGDMNGNIYTNGTVKGKDGFNINLTTVNVLFTFKF